MALVHRYARVGKMAAIAIAGLAAASCLAVAAPPHSATAAPVGDIKWRNWVFGEFEKHRASSDGKTLTITTRYKDSAGDRDRAVLRLDPASGALHAEYRLNGTEYGYTVVCTERDVCWYKNIDPTARWVEVPPGHIQLKRIVSQKRDLFLGLIAKGDLSKNRAVRRSAGSYTDFPTFQVYEDVRAGSGRISYRKYSKYMIAKGKAQTWYDTTLDSEVGGDPSQLLATMPQPVNVLDVPWGFRVISFYTF